MIKRSLLLINLSLLTFFISGCTTSNFKTVHIPEFNKVSRAEVGENMYQKIYAAFSHEQDIKLLNEASIKSLGIEFNQEKNTPIELVKLSNGENAGYSRGFYFIDENNTGIFKYVRTEIIPGLVKTYSLDNPVKYEIVPAQPEFYSVDSYKKVALYQGKIGNKINISFREFQDNLARPAFTQDIEYELDAKGSTIVGFQGLRINVIKATNVDIEYTVLKGYQ